MNQKKVMKRSRLRIQVERGHFLASFTSVFVVVIVDLHRCRFILMWKSLSMGFYNTIIVNSASFSREMPLCFFFFDIMISHGTTKQTQQKGS